VTCLYPSCEVKTYYNKKVIGIDVLRENEIGKNTPSALIIENNIFFAVDEMGRKKAIN
jgi:hypothetical protein